MARVASEKASSPTPLGLAPERQSGVRALIIARPVGREKVPRNSPYPFSPPGRRVRFIASRSLLLSRLLADSWGRPDPHSQAWLMIEEGRRSPRPHGLSLRVAALQHSRLPRPFCGAGTDRGLYTRARNARTHGAADHPYTRGRRRAYHIHTALNPDGDFSTPTPPWEVWG